MEDANNLIGTVVAGRFLLQGLLGQGGMGAVYLARHEFMGRTVALKLLHREMQAEVNVLSGFEREARAAARIGNPHVAQVHDFGYTEEGEPYLAMEYVPGRSLAQMLEDEGPQDVERALRLLIQATRGLASAHEVGVIHRDIKPQNMMLTTREEADHLVLLDFGLAKITDPSTIVTLTSLGSSFVTPRYMAPEQVTDSAEVDHRADIYSLGVVAYEMLAGRTPFSGSALELLRDHQRGEIEPLDELTGGKVPAALSELVLGCLAKNPADRPDTAAALGKQIGSLLRLLRIGA